MSLSMLLIIISSQFPHELYKYKRFFIILFMMKKHALDGSISLTETVFIHQQPFLLSI